MILDGIQFQLVLGKDRDMESGIELNNYQAGLKKLFSTKTKYFITENPVAAVSSQLFPARKVFFFFLFQIVVFIYRILDLCMGRCNSFSVLQK